MPASAMLPLRVVELMAPEGGTITAYHIRRSRKRARREPAVGRVRLIQRPGRVHRQSCVSSATGSRGALQACRSGRRREGGEE